MSDTNSVSAAAGTAGLMVAYLQLVHALAESQALDPAILAARLRKQRDLLKVPEIQGFLGALADAVEKGSELGSE